MLISLYFPHIVEWGGTSRGGTQSNFLIFSPVAVTQVLNSFCVL